MIRTSVILILLSLVLSLPAFAVDKETLAARGYITIQTDNIDAIKEKIKELVVKYNADTRYDVDNLAPNKRRAHIEIGLDIGSAPDLLMEIINLDGLDLTNYNRYDKQNTIADLARRLSNATRRKIPADKILDLENRLKAARNSTWEATWAKIDVDIYQKVVANDLATNIHKIKTNWPLIITALVFLIIGIFIRTFIKTEGFGLIEMLVAMLIVMLLVFLYMKLVWKNGGMSRQTKKALTENGIKANHPQDMGQHAQETVDQLNQRSEKTQKQYEENE